MSLLFMLTFFTLTALICSVIHVETILATGKNIPSRALLVLVSLQCLYSGLISPEQAIPVQSHGVILQVAVWIVG